MIAVDEESTHLLIHRTQGQDLVQIVRKSLQKKAKNLSEDLHQPHRRTPKKYHVKNKETKQIF